MRSIRSCDLLVMLMALTMASVCARQSSQRQRSIPDTATERERQGRISLQQGDLLEAEHQFQMALSLDPGFVPALEGLGVVALEREDIGQARQYFQMGLELDETFAPLWIGFGRALAAEGQNEQALERYERAIQLDPHAADAFYYLGRSYVHLKDYSRAEEAFKKTLDRDPSHAGASEDWSRLARQRSSPNDLPPEYMEIVKKGGVNRADLAALLAHGLPMEDLCGSEQGNGLATDIQDHWALGEIRQVVSCGLMTMYPDGTFRPRQRMTRRDGACLVYNILLRRSPAAQPEEPAESSASPFPDVSSEDRDLLAMRTAFSLGIMEVKPDGAFRPEDELTGYAAMRMVRALKERI